MRSLLYRLDQNIIQNILMMRIVLSFPSDTWVRCNREVQLVSL
ncbi:MAG: hypothetical protein BSOLF_1395 [Candidatus Carbobacillus altaicus]|uniref:Uncharacterized protein n=1 Tax=Candidatus Carbonibacillus altaicus TaxID=2163959 RepID=A0A2R6Y4A6_9BACL|nr:MAG: hypothetical protein BSOLF_1395 [Candidatus Carbobacillus altaicus]